MVLRFAGILTGSALAIALILATMGTPRIAIPAKEKDELPALEPADDPAFVASAAVTDSADNDAAPLVLQPTPQRTLPEPPAVAAAAPDVALPPANNAAQAEPSSWYAFWSPFRSEIAADGFVARLQQTTGLDYRVVKLEPGIYEVAFAYSDDTDRAEKLRRISAATGLDLSGS